MQGAGSLATGEPIPPALQTATKEQLSSIMGLASAKGGFVTLNRHLNLEQLEGLGWQALQPLMADPEKGSRALEASIATLRHFGAAPHYIADYQAIIQRALNGEAIQMLIDSRQRGSVPLFLAYENGKVPIPGPLEGHWREARIFIFFWRPELDFPSAPLFHAQSVSSAQDQSGVLDVSPGSVFPGQDFSPELAGANDLKLSVVSAVYGAKLNGKAPPPEAMGAWDRLLACQLLKGPISLQRNWNPKFLTLESEASNSHRMACLAALLKKLSSRVLHPDASRALRDHLWESQATGLQPGANDFTLEEGNNMMLTEALANEGEVDAFTEIINVDMCPLLHPHKPCKFWNKSYGAVPDAVSAVPFNDQVLCARHLVSHPEPPQQQDIASEEPPPAARRMLRAFNWERPKSAHQAMEKRQFIDDKMERLTAAVDAAGLIRNKHRHKQELIKWRHRRWATEMALQKFQEKEAAQRYSDDDP